MRNFIFILVLLLSAMNVLASKDLAGDGLYKKGQYEEAAIAYEKLLTEGESASLLYNIGNCYYKLNNWGKAILYYEKALIHSPTDADILFNLRMANAHTSDKAVTSSPGIKKWFYSQLMVVSPDTWTLCGLVAGIIALVLLFFARQRSKRAYKLAGRWLLLPFVVLVLFGWLLSAHLNQRSMAVILEPSVDVKTAPGDNSKAAFILHEGAKVTVTREKTGWTEIEFDNERKGWIKNTSLGII